MYLVLHCFHCNIIRYFSRYHYKGQVIQQLEWKV